MAIYQILEEIKDVRKEGELCDFNGYLEDYLEVIDSSEDQPMKDILHALFEENHDLKICVNLRADINRQVISNQIIRYKDAFKLQGHPVICPVIIYGKQDDAERALILVQHSDRSYLYAKGLYYTLTEPYSFLADCKNELVAVTAESVDGVLATFRKLFSVKAGALQREADRNRFSNYEQLKKDALDEAEAVKENAETELREAEDKEAMIYSLVVRWFLLKKVVYVQYMVNKDMLQNVHEGNIKNSGIRRRSTPMKFRSSRTASCGEAFNLKIKLTVMGN